MEGDLKPVIKIVFTDPLSWQCTCLDRNKCIRNETGQNLKNKRKRKCLSGSKINEKRNHVFVMPFPKDGILVPTLFYKCMLILPNFMEMSSTAI